jgi:iron uptake system component EfeO
MPACVRTAPRALTWVASLAATGLLAACSSGGKADAGTSGAAVKATNVAVKAGAKTCEVSASELPAGRHTFEVDNTASQITEVYVYAPGDRIVAEIENVGPSTKRSLIVDLAAGSYEVACKPGMTGDGIRSKLTVTGQTAAPETVDQRLTAAVASYRTYVEQETQALVDTTGVFVAAVKAGNIPAAERAYPTARLHYERIEPIAESFGDLDPLIDMRIDDVTRTQPFTGFHRIEQDLYAKKSIAADGPIADQLLADTKKLQTLVKTVSITPLTMANGAKSLLDEVAKSKVTGEEERYSRVDLVDFAGNVDGAKYVYSALRPVIAERSPALATTLDARFSSLIALLGTHTATEGQKGYVAGSPYVSYDDLTPAQVKALAVEVDAISEPLGSLSGVVTAG